LKRKSQLFSLYWRVSEWLESVSLVVARAGCYFHIGSNPKKIESWYLQLPCLTSALKGFECKNNLVILLVVSLGKALNGMPLPLSAG